MFKSIEEIDAYNKNINILGCTPDRSDMSLCSTG